MRLKRFLSIDLCVVLLAFLSADAAISGSALILDATGNIRAVNTATGAASPIVLKSDFASYHDLGGPCFSPDGKKVAYVRGQSGTAEDGVHILVVDNDHSDITEICRTYATYPPDEVVLSWANNGYIYWSECNDKVYRVNVATKVREQVVALSQLSGAKPSHIDFLNVSLDGTRGGCMVSGTSDGSFGFDFTARTSKSFGMGCQGTVSPNGLLATHNLASYGNYSYHQLALIHNFDNGQQVDSMVVPGFQPNCGSNCPRFVFHRFSHSSNDHVVFSGEDGLEGKCYVHCLSTNENVLIGNGRAYDFWNGALPPPPSTGPIIVLDSGSLGFSSMAGSTPAAKTVHVTNGGTGTLTNVSFSGNPAWLTVTRGGNGNAQTLINTVNVSGLQSGVYNATITVSGGGATNSINYTVTLNVAGSLLAPTALAVSASGTTGARLAWTDNTSTEQGFSIQRKVAGGAWQSRASVAANTAAWTDTGLAALTMYHYRVKAFTATDSSAWSNEDSVALSQVETITVTSPVAGSTWHPGDTMRIRWTAVNVGLVDVSYSADAGLSWLLANSSSIGTTTPLWGNYPWVIPNLTGDSITIRVSKYGSAAVYGVSPRVRLSPSAGVANSVSMNRADGLLRVSRATDSRLMVRYSGNAVMGPLKLQVHSLNGSLLYCRELPAVSGDGETTLFISKVPALPVIVTLRTRSVSRTLMIP